jgi:hypothetical protein
MASAHGAGCPICGLAGAVCGEPSAATPIDAALYGPPNAPTAVAERAAADVQALQEAARLARRAEAGMDMVKIDRGDGVIFKFSEDDAKRYLAANPGAKRVGGRRVRVEAEPEAEQPDVEAKAVQPADVSNKAVTGPRTQRAER